jgi:hypothetical protein
MMETESVSETQMDLNVLIRLSDQEDFIEKF